MAASFTYLKETTGFRISRLPYWFSVAAFLTGLIFTQVTLAGSAAAQAYAGPHGSFSDDSQFCLLCHDIHDAPGPRLERFMPESAVCFTCHNGTGSQYNTEAQMNMDPAVNAMHPITVNLANNRGTYSYVPNTTAGVASPGPYDCSQCHNPHGDEGFGKLLRASYDTSEYVQYSSTANPYNACWSCHDAQKIVNDTTFFKEHKKHIIDKKSPCSACHYSPHGVPYTEMVRFNGMYVTKSISKNSGPTFVDKGDRHGSCTLTCHGEDHQAESY